VFLTGAWLVSELELTLDSKSVHINYTSRKPCSRSHTRTPHVYLAIHYTNRGICTETPSYLPIPISFHRILELYIFPLRQHWEKLSLKTIQHLRTTIHSFDDLQCFDNPLRELEALHCTSRKLCIRNQSRIPRWDWMDFHILTLGICTESSRCLHIPISFHRILRQCILKLR